MKKGISIWAFTPASCEEQFALAKQYGFDGVELSLDEEGAVSLSSGRADAETVKQAAENAGIELYSIATGLYWSHSLTSNDRAEREKAEDIVKKQLERAAWLGCDTILIVPGATGVDFAPALGVVPYEDAYLRAQEALRRLAPVAEGYRVSIGLENVWNKFLLSPLEMRRFIDEIGSPFVGSYFDIANVLLTGYPEDWISILGDRIKKVHFKDYRRAISNFCDLLEGDVDYETVMRALRSVGYDGWVTAEVGPYASHNEVKLTQTSLAMDKVLGNDPSAWLGRCFASE